MNLWAKSLRQLAIFAVALFFFSCEDDTISGYKTNPKFDIIYKEFDVPSSVILLDSVRTSNFTTSELSRFLVGQLDDENFGNIKATAFSQFFTSASFILPNTAVFDSVSLTLRYDLYYQGVKDFSPQTIEIHELTDKINPSLAQYYFNTSNNAVGDKLGSKTFVFNTDSIDTFLAATNFTRAIYNTIPLTTPEGVEFGSRIFATAERYRDTPEIDSALYTYGEFIELFKGIRISATTANKVMGFNAQGSFIKVSYHESGKTDPRSFTLALGPVGISYTHIDADRSSTELSGLTAYSTPYLPSSDLRYIQAGTGIATQIDLEEFTTFLAADSNKNLIINEAALVITAVEPVEYDTLSVLSLRILNDQYQPIRVALTSDSTAVANGNAALTRQIILYSNYLNVLDGIYTPMNEQQSNVTLSKNSDNAYVGYPTFFLQQLHTQNGKRVFSKYALYPQSPSFSKSLNGFIFNKNNLKLRITYTRPI
jgi:hypothetical protein